MGDFAIATAIGRECWECLQRLDRSFLKPCRKIRSKVDRLFLNSLNSCKTPNSGETWRQIAVTPPRSAYVHVPFCRRRCFYCDFPISVVGDRKHGENSQTVRAYVNWLCAEIQATPPRDRPLETVFFGGGTPSLLSVSQLDRILTTLDRHFGIVGDAEISIEMDPGTFDRAKLRGFLKAGITRVSFGAQAFQDELLQYCGRSHSVADIYTAFDLLETEGIANVSFDLMSGLPHQTPQQWEASLEAALNLDPAHLSLYDLILEPGTVFDRFYKPDAEPFPDSETAANLYRLAQQRLTAAGYGHYEISNYAKPGFECRHNLTYWCDRPYYGFGLGATSYVGGLRFARPRTRKAYAEWVERYVNSGGEIEAETVSDSDLILETLMLRFRLAEGLAIAELQQNVTEKTLQRFWQAIAPYLNCGWMKFDDDAGKDKRVRLSDPEGFLFSNVILSTLFEQLEDCAELQCFHLEI
ncbi:radical SAM family heme chaperone HemW [Geitlerinema sp. CS-897]|nr:radical SAM family heme chaperone HemW [Geitlerinema sp. CS-897]